MQSPTEPCIDKELILQAKHQLTPSNERTIELLEMDAQQLKLSDDSFDLVVCPWVLQMVNDPNEAVNK